MAAHRRFTIATDVAVYFCDPASPWQRGYEREHERPAAPVLPQGTDLAGYSQADLDAVARETQRRPRQTLGFQTPAEKLTELIDGLHTGEPRSAYGLRSTAPGVG